MIKSARDSSSSDRQYSPYSERCLSLMTEWHIFWDRQNVLSFSGCLIWDHPGANVRRLDFHSQRKKSQFWWMLMEEIREGPITGHLHGCAGQLRVLWAKSLPLLEVQILSTLDYRPGCSEEPGDSVGNSQRGMCGPWHQLHSINLGWTKSSFLGLLRT